MYKIGKIDDRALALMEQKGIKSDDILLATHADMDNMTNLCTTWLFLTSSDLHVLSVRAEVSNTGAPEITEGKPHHGHLLSVYKELSYSSVPCDVIGKLKVDEMISTVRLVAYKKFTGDPDAELPQNGEAFEDTEYSPYGHRAHKKGEATEHGKSADKKASESTEKPAAESEKSEADSEKPVDPFEKKKRYDGLLSLTYSTNSCKSSLYKFVKYYELARKGEDLMKVPEHDLDSDFCPKCGEKYPNPSSRVCPHCTSTAGVFARMGHFMWKYKVSVLSMLAILLVSSAVAVITPYISSAFFYNQVLTPDDGTGKYGQYYGMMILVLGIIVGTRLLSTLISMANGIISSNMSARVVCDLKKVIFESVERLSVNFFMGRTTGGLMNQVNSDSNTIYWFFTDGLPYFLVYVLQIVAVTIVMFCINWVLALFALITMPIAIIMIKFMFGKMRTFHNKRYSRQRYMRSILSDILTGVRVVKAFAKEGEETTRFDRASKDLANAAQSTSFYAGIGFPIVNFVIYISSIVVWGVGGYMAMNTFFGETWLVNMDYGMLLTFVSYVGMIYGGLYFLVDMVQTGADCFNAMARLFEVMDAQPEITEVPDALSLPEPKGDVSLKNVEFSYVKGRKILDGISFDIKAGHTVGIVGHTGAGKTTLANLIIRLYDTEEGSIEIDGIDIKKLKLADLRHTVAVVSQETYLFVGTILDNIRYANPAATYDDVVAAAKASAAHDFIVKLPDGYYTKVGSGYKDLSGGERQRVSIARALLHDPKILILDEATAAMDTQTERKIQNALESLKKGRTTISIAHRLSTLRDADYLIVIENGKMAEYGTHEELLQKEGIYHRLYTIQLEALKNMGIEES